MDTIALKKSKENALKKRMKTIKKGIKVSLLMPNILITVTLILIEMGAWLN